jgi:large subunit ribosomal protein L16
MAHSVQRGGKIWIRVFPHTAVTKKAAEVPMGAGKGSLDYFAQTINSGTIIFEMDGLPEDKAREALRLAAHKLPLKTKITKTLTLA